MGKDGRRARRLGDRFILSGCAMGLAFTLLLSLPITRAGAAATGGVRGDVVSYETNAPVKGANVFLPGYGARALSRWDGTFAFSQRFPTDHPFRRIEAMVTAPGFGLWTISGVPLYDGDLLELHVQLRRHDWTHHVTTPQERMAARRRAPSRPASYTSTCTGWNDELLPPQNIWVWRVEGGVSEQYDFAFYLTHVLPDEWIASWDADALGAGAIAAKTYAWYRTQPGHAYRGGSGCADLQDSTADQVFDPTWSNAATDQAVYATLGSILRKDGDIFLSQYFAGAKGDPCAPVEGEYAGRMSQWGTQTCATESMLWPDIVTTFYPTGTSWTNRLNWLLDPGAESTSSYPWTKKNAASFTRDAGSGHSGGYYFTLTPKAGKTGSARNQRPINGTANTTYQTSVALLCPPSNPSRCSITLKVLAITETGGNPAQTLTFTEGREAGWKVYTLNTTGMGVTHIAVMYVVSSPQVVQIDDASVNSSFGGP